MSYIGRFAPSPSGPLHIGSLIAALASYLDAHANHGQWLLRMEDLDPPREIPGAADMILQSLRAHQLQWHGKVLRQSHRLDAYRSIAENLLARGQAYYCDCSRARIKDTGGIYDGRCRRRGLHPDNADTALALRLRFDDTDIAFNDAIQGPQQQQPARDAGDMIIQRKDGLYAYQLAVVVDDGLQGINHIVRGSDLLSSTARQIFLQRQLGLATPGYSHIPVIANSDGQKLSKQNMAPALDDSRACDNLRSALQFLQQAPPPAGLGCTQILQWAISHWQLKNIPAQMSICPD